jgi:HD superfamily phosphohydrolase
MPSFRKIINDPVYGFITIDQSLIFDIISHPYYQRLRRIHQMAFAELVYPGAVHSRLHHSLGAYHLMCNALSELRSKGVDITPEEDTAAKIAILLHDVGHGPYSHALEHILIPGHSHESMSILIMHHLNKIFNGKLDTAIAVFTDQYPKRFLHQLVSGQLDVDRMDYLSRDSFFTGVSEGVIGYDRILKMLTVHNGQLMVEEKAIYSIEKFLVARRLMYWQVYLHKTVLSAEKMLVRIIERAQQLIRMDQEVRSTSSVLDFFLNRQDPSGDIDRHLDKFCKLDDYDIFSTIKCWASHPDKVLSNLCRMLVERKLLKVSFASEPFGEDHVEKLEACAQEELGLTRAETGYFVFSGEAVNTMYNVFDERIHILFKDGTVKDITKVNNALIHQTLSSPVKKFYICYLGNNCT